MFLKTLKLICSAAEEGDTQKAFLRMYDGSASAYNDLYSISAGVNIPVNCNPHAATMLSAINSAGDDANFTLMQSGKLKVSKGKYKAFVNCNANALPIPLIRRGAAIAVDGKILRDAFAILHKFCAPEKLNRPWATGVMIRNGCAEATNNHILLQYWLSGLTLSHDIVVPAETCKLIGSMKDKAPTHVQTDGKTVTFHYDDGMLITSRTLEPGAWMNSQAILDAHKADAQYSPVHTDFYSALKNIAAFLGPYGYVHIDPYSISTGKDEDGATVEFAGTTPVCSSQITLNFQDLLLLDGIAQNIAFNLYPRNLLFKGENLRGIISVVRT